MTVFTNYRRVLLTSSALIAVVSVVLAAGVIPPVSADVFPNATPERAVPAFWTIVVMNLVGAGLLGRLAVTRSHGRTARRVLGTFVGLVMWLIAFAMTNAAFAYQKHGEGMRLVSALLFVCVAAEGVAGVLALVGVFLRETEL